MEPRTKMMLKKMEILRGQEKLLSKILSTKLDLLEQKFQQKYETGSNDNNSVLNDFYKLDCLAEFLGNTLLKLQDDSCFQDNPEDKSAQPSNNHLLFEVQSHVGSARTEKTEMPSQNFYEGWSYYQTHMEEKCITESSQALDPKLHDIHKCFEDLEEFKQVQISLRKDLTVSQEESYDLQVKVKDLQTQVGFLIEDHRCHNNTLKRLRSKYQALKQSAKKAELQEKGTLMLLTKRVSNLETLRNILNETRSRDARQQTVRHLCQENRKVLEKIEENLSSLGTEMKQIKRPSVGFTAQITRNRCLDSNGELVDMYHLVSNVGSRFKASTGSFVAPHDGLYGFCVKLVQTFNTNYTGYLMTQTGNGRPLEQMKIPVPGREPHSATCVLDLAKGAVVSLRIETHGARVELKSSIAFSGWSIGYDF